MEQANCNLCGSDRLNPLYTMPDMRFATPGLYTVVECSACGLGFINPRPTFAELPALYPSEFYERFEIVDQSGRYAREAKYIESVKGSSKQRTLLDVGCATGGFLRYMREQGWQVEGIEPIYSDLNTDLTIHRTQIFATPGLTGRFDVVTAWAVLEHVHDPSAYFKAMTAALRPGGRLVVQVPNFDSISSRCLFREDVPRHLHFYSRRAIDKFMAQNGLTIERVEYRDDVYEMSAVGLLTYLLYRLVNRPYTHQDVPTHYADFCRQRSLTPGTKSFLRYLFVHPLSVADKAVAPLVDRVQILRGTYGQVTYVARKTAI
jgi:2-polyprenyl-3-methyl-5-hydroxy-6-metoxy-1,4-benzoquinol methylase